MLTGKVPKATWVYCWYWSNKISPSSLEIKEEEHSRTGRSWEEGKNLVSPDQEEGMAVWPGFEGVSMDLDAEDHGAMCLGEAGQRPIKESQRQEYIFRESRQVQALVQTRR